MLKLLAITFVLIHLNLAYPQSFDTQNDPNSRIIGGNNASIEDYPYALQLEYHTEVHELIGGAVLIAPNWAITACHVLYDRDMDFILRAGTTDRGKGGETYTVIKTHCHPNFVWDSDTYDIALLQTDRAVTAPNTGIISMADEDSTIPEGKSMMTVGWGYNVNGGNDEPFPDVLQSLEMPVLDNATCATLLAHLASYSESMFCGGYMEGGKGFCWADNGGPAVYDGILIGISSWVNYCATADTPGAFTIISLVRPWIDGIINA